MTTKSPREQKNLGRLVKDFDQAIWDENAQEIVYRGNMLKFTQCKEARNVLFETAGKTLVEVNPDDTIWGIGLGEFNPDRLDRATWNGKNWLGEILTRVREKLIKLTEFMTK